MEMSIPTEMLKNRKEDARASRGYQQFGLVYMKHSFFSTDGAGHII